MGSGIVRPGPLRWIGYAFGAGLPERHHPWVLHDVTARTWFLRHLARALVQLVPFAVALYVLLGPVLGLDRVIVLAAVAAGAGMGLFYSAAFAWGSTEHRAVRAGYPEGTVEVVRAERRREERAGHRR
jgi:apolipoprotein N-acyltransferase